MKAAIDVTGFRDRVTIQSASQSSDSQGGYTETWNDGSTVWADVTPLKAYEQFQASQMQVPQTHKIIIRYTTEITSASRLKYGTRIFWVKEIINVEQRGRFLIVKALERA